MAKTALLSVILALVLVDASPQSRGQSADLSAERASNAARIAAINREAGPIANQLQHVLQQIETHNSHKPAATDTAAVARFNGESDQLNQKKRGFAANLQALQDEQDRLVARNKAIDESLAQATPGKQPEEEADVTPSWTGTWNETDQKIVSDALDGFQHAELKDWIVRNVRLERFARDNFSPITAYESTVRFKAGFFSNDLNSDDRESLLAFEAGKVFWNEMKDKPVEPGGKTLENWFNNYGHSSVTEEMQAAPHNGSKLSGLGDLDGASQFGYIFRAKAIKLDKPRDPIARQKWDNVIHDFDAKIGPLLRDDH